MTVLRQEQISKMDESIRAGRLSGRGAAQALGVTEGALRYRRKRLASGARDRRSDQATALDDFQDRVATVLEGLASTASAPPQASRRASACRRITTLSADGHVMDGACCARVLY